MATAHAAGAGHAVVTQIEYQLRVLAQVPNLPPEIITAICRNADCEVLKTLRFVTKQMNSYAAPELFRVFHLKANKLSFQRLNTTEFAHLLDYVRVVEYDGRLLPWQLHDYDNDLSMVADVPGWLAFDTHGQRISLPKVHNAIREYYTMDEVDDLMDHYEFRLGEQKEFHRNHGSYEDVS